MLYVFEEHLHWDVFHYNKTDKQSVDFPICFLFQPLPQYLSLPSAVELQAASYWSFSPAASISWPLIML